MRGGDGTVSDYWYDQAKLIPISFPAADQTAGVGVHKTNGFRM
jgi:hypothetical protein